MKKILLTIVALLCIIGSEAKNKEVVWEKPTTENGNVYGDGFFNIADSWENIIKEYNVTGSNVAHFNLPEEQQSAIERYLKVNSFPTYKLVGPQGNVLDIKVSPFNLQALEEVIKMLKVEN